MTTRTFAPLGAILIAAVLNAAMSAPAGATDVPITDFQGAWVATATYGPGAIVTYKGASYVCIVQNSHVAPATGLNYWKVMDAAGATGATGPAGPQGPAGPTGPAGPQGPPGAGGLLVIDSRGSVVGKFVIWIPVTGPYQGALITTSNMSFLAPISAGGFVGQNVLYYVSSDCSGSPLILSITQTFPDLFTYSVIVGTGTTAYIAGAPANSFTGPGMEVYSFLYGSQQCSSDPGGGRVNIGNFQNVASTVDLSTLGFVPPFTVQ